MGDEYVELKFMLVLLSGEMEPKREMSIEPMKALEAETESTKIMTESHPFQRWEGVKVTTVSEVSVS